MLRFLTATLSRPLCKLLCLLLWCSALPQNANAANSFTISLANATLNQTQLNANAEFTLKLNDTVTEAIHNGIPVTLTSRLTLLSKRSLIPNKHLATWQQRHTISYHSLSDRYQLESTNRHDTQSFASIRELLSSIEAYSLNTDLVSHTMPKSAKGYLLRLRIKLDIEALPPALRIVAYVSRSWRLKSETRSWTVQPNTP